MHKIHTAVKQVAIEAVKQRLLSKVGESAKHFPGQCSRVLKRVSERRCDTQTLGAWRHIKQARIPKY